MDRVQVFRAYNNRQSLSPRDKGYSLDDMNDKGAFNNSSLGIVETALLVEPSGWYLGRLYYVVIKGYTVGVFHELAAVHRSVDVFPSAMWHTCKTWKEAIRVWSVACANGTIDILRKDGGNAAVSVAARISTPPRRKIDAAAAHRCESPPPASAASTPLFSTLKKQLPVVVVVTDSDSDYSDSTDSEIESTSPKPIKRNIDDFELPDDENGSPYSRKMYDVVMDARLDAPTTPKRRKSPPPAASGSGHKLTSLASTSHSRAPLQPSSSYRSAAKIKRETTRAAAKSRKL
ncbi:hypothetical protein HYPSUDRAFT_198044 [Hypholoma sublateritium FD-334 SS-4]|uniref:Uncharacterized protein n=1 Tax=Hypholoma sublateritium (strain FD-334 SS-4) TaxID=945553 RepID=A0A0D2PAH8_HYPSF|nr:hypothetical protein HYPSUDRAFT_198044 [Hypholoma sublateritium FD-334 SS-4]